MFTVKLVAMLFLPFSFICVSPSDTDDCLRSFAFLEASKIIKMIYFMVLDSKNISQGRQGRTLGGVG